MFKTVFVVGLAVLWGGWSSSIAGAEAQARYAIIVRKEANEGAWGPVVKALESKHQGRSFVYSESVAEVNPQVAEYAPRYVCFVCPPTENFPDFVVQANKICRMIDSDPYVDAIWGILTGYDERHALSLIDSDPIMVKRAFTKTQGIWLDWGREGDYVTEWTRDRGEIGVKKADAAFQITSGGPGDDVEDSRYVHEKLSQDAYDLIIGSGHGDHNQWMLMFPRGSGFLLAIDKKLTVQSPGGELPLEMSHPKLYWAVGNCLTGVVNSPGANYRDSYALAWMNQGAKQYIGAVQPTWYELNWNMADWFLKQEGRWTFSESLFLLRQWSQFLLDEQIVQGNDRRGTEYTDEIFVLYGDPALDGRIAPTRDPALAESLDIQETGDPGVVRVTYQVKVNFVGEGNKRTAEKYDGWRIFSHLLPCQVTDVEVESSNFAKVVVPGETLIWDAGKGLQVGEERRVVFRARRVR